tara:strand:- start:1486 stop:1920 length:435 start_codon:yes stop_codon:yes gene_type:complete
MKKNTSIYVLIIINLVLFFSVLSNKPELSEANYFDNINIFNSKLLEFQDELISLKKELAEITYMLSQLNQISYDIEDTTSSFEENNSINDVYDYPTQEPFRSQQSINSRLENPTYEEAIEEAFMILEDLEQKGAFDNQGDIPQQ